MAVGITASSVTATSVTFALSSLAADGTVDVQIGVTPDFRNCVAPIMSVARSTPQTISNLNQRTSYFARARARRVSGAVEAWSAVTTFRTASSALPDFTPPAVNVEPATIVVPVPVLTWTADNEVAGFPASNLGFDAPVGWRQTVAGTTASVLLYASLEEVDTVALLMSNAPENATVDVAAGTTASTSNFSLTGQPFRASANLDGRAGYHSLIRLGAGQFYPFWRITINLPTGAPGGIFHLDHLIIGRNRVTKNHAVDMTEQGLDLGSMERTRSGVPHRTYGLRGRRVDFEIAVMTDQAYHLAYGDLFRLVGSSDPVLVVPNSKAGPLLHDRFLYGALVAGRISRPYSTRVTKQFGVESILP